MIYIVDDNLLYCDLLEGVSREVFKETKKFFDGNKFLSQLDSITANDLIFLDLSMPTIDGVEILHELKQAQCKASIILISGCEQAILNSSAQLAKEYGLNVISKLKKPIRVQSILSTLLKFLEHNYQSNTSQTRRVNKAIEITKEELLTAIKNHQLVLHFQPQLHLGCADIVGVEALVRWEHPNFGLIYPDTFIHLAEKYDLMNELTNEVMRMAIQEGKEWQALGYNFRVSINISASNITSLSLPEKLQELLNDNDVNPGTIEFEITESELMEELQNSLNTLTRLRLKGFGLSIDDFGTGYSSLTQLNRNPFNELKIDSSFVSNMCNDASCEAIVESCIRLSHKLGMVVVAEGVETKGCLDRLASLKCDVVQGYYIAKPMNKKDLLNYLHKSKSKCESCFTSKQLH